MRKEIESFVGWRYGMFVHYGLYSALGRGEWVMNREQIAAEEMEELAKGFRPDAFDADAICDLAVESGMKYIVLTTMHHDGFRLYKTALTDYNSYAVCGRDLVSELVAAARRHGLKIGLYHSLNNWHDQPDGVSALESPEGYQEFIDHTFARIRELVTLFNPIDVLWYDGWWPFDDKGWKAEEMNAMVRAIQPHIIVNGRNGLPGDFGTPEQNLKMPCPWRPWEACITINGHFGYHASDDEWKSPRQVIQMLLACANGRGNLLLNVGPRGDGSIPEESVKVLRSVGQWLRDGGSEAIADTDFMGFNSVLRGADDRTDWDGSGTFTASGNNLFYTMTFYPGKTLVLTGLEMTVRRISCTQAGELPFTQEGGRLAVSIPEALRLAYCPVLKMECDGMPSIYRTGGMRTPRCKHPRYDPIRE